MVEEKVEELKLSLPTTVLVAHGAEEGRGCKRFKPNANDNVVETAADMSRYMLTPKVKVDTWERDGIFPHKLPRLPASLSQQDALALTQPVTWAVNETWIAWSFTRLMTV